MKPDPKKPDDAEEIAGTEEQWDPSADFAPEAMPALPDDAYPPEAKPIEPIDEGE